MKTVALRRQLLAAAVVGLLLVGALLPTGCGSTGGTGTSDQGTLVAPGQPSGGPGGLAWSPGAVSDSSVGKGTANAPEASPAQTTARSSQGAVVGVADAARMVVRTVSMRLKVDDVDKTARRVAALAGSYQGYVQSMQISSDAGGPVYPPGPVPLQDTGTGSSGSGQLQGTADALAGYVTVRVPARSLERFRRDVTGLGKILYEATDSQDVTAEHADLKARLKNLEATEIGLRRLFNKAKTVTEMLAIQEQLTQIQGQIESLTAQIKVLNDQAAMSTATVQLVGPEPVVSPSGDDWGFTTALRTAVRAFVGTINVLIVAIGASLPLLTIIALGVLLIVWLVRRSSRKSRPATATGLEPTERPPVEGTPDERDDA